MVARVDCVVNVVWVIGCRFQVPRQLWASEASRRASGCDPRRHDSSVCLRARDRQPVSLWVLAGRRFPPHPIPLPPGERGPVSTGAGNRSYRAACPPSLTACLRTSGKLALRDGLPEPRQGLSPREREIGASRRASRTSPGPVSTGGAIVLPGEGDVARQARRILPRHGGLARHGRGCCPRACLASDG